MLNNGFCFYGSISYKHQPKKDDLLEGISLQFFFEEKLLFRAELNRKEENAFNDDIEHPQPHWHFHILLERPYQKGNPQSDFNIFVQKETQFEQSIKKEVALSEMHFPMDFNNAYLGSIDFDQKWNEDKIKDWINMTTQSIMKELDFIKVKLHCNIMRIGILTLPPHANYGGILQAYALQTVLERMGHDVVVFNKPIEKQVLPFPMSFLHYIVRFIKKYIFKKTNVYVFKEQKIYKYQKANTLYTDAFVNTHLHNKFIDTLGDIKNEYDAIIVGSDQVWRKIYFNGSWEKSNPADAYLAFTNDWNIKRIAHAASFGVDYLEVRRYRNTKMQGCNSEV